MDEKQEVSKKEKIAAEYEQTVAQINHLYIKLCIWELEKEISFTEEKKDLIELRGNVDKNLKEVLENEKE